MMVNGRVQYLLKYKILQGLFKDAFDILQCQYKEKIDGVKKILETTTKIVIDSQNAKDDAWSSKVKV